MVTFIVIRKSHDFGNFGVYKKCIDGLTANIYTSLKKIEQNKPNHFDIF